MADIDGFLTASRAAKEDVKVRTGESLDEEAKGEAVRRRNEEALLVADLNGRADMMGL